MAEALVKVLIVSAADSRFMPLLRSMLASIQPVSSRPGFTVACFDIGLDQADRDWLVAQGHTVVVPGAQFGLDPAKHSAALRSFLARPFLPDTFPGYDVYVWIDSDVWLQDPGVVDRYVDAAQRMGMSIAHERERAYRVQPWLFGWTAKHFLKGYGPLTGAGLLARRHLNAGFFAAHASAPHWAAWARRYEAAIHRSGALVPHDQFALVQAVHTGASSGRGKLATAILQPENNWICDRGVPMWDDDAGVFCKPYAPYAAIGAMHLAGPAKVTPYVIRRRRGGSFTTFLTHGASPASPATVGPLGTRQPNVVAQASAAAHGQPSPAVQLS